MATTRTKNRRSGRTQSLLESTSNLALNAPETSTSPSKSDLKKTTIESRTGLKWTGYEELGADQKTVEAAAREIKVRLKRSVEDIFVMGRLLSQVRSILKYGMFGEWLNAEFDLEERAAYRMISVYERFGDSSDIMSELPIGPTVLYYLAAQSTPDEAIDDAIEETQKTGQKLTMSRAEELVRRRREQQLERELKQLNRLPKKDQDAIAAKMESDRSQSFFQAKKQHMLESAAEHRDVEVLGPEVDLGQIQYNPGNWESVLADLPETTEASLMFVECPLRDDFLPEYKEIAYHAYRLLRVGGKLIVNASQRNILFLGSLLEPPLIARLCFNAHLRHGESTPQPGLNYWQSWMPMALAYKEKWDKPPEMVDTSRSSDISLEESVEKAADYYTRSYTRQGETLIHVVTDPDCYDLSGQIAATARDHNLGKLIGVGVSGP